MSHFFDFYNPISEKLPESFIQDIIYSLNKMYNEKEYYWKKLNTSGLSSDVVYMYTEKYHSAYNKLQGAIKLLRDCGLNPVRLPFKPNTYTIPSYQDCEAWEDYSYEKSDY